MEGDIFPFPSRLFQGPDWREMIPHSSDSTAKKKTLDNTEEREGMKEATREQKTLYKTIFILNITTKIHKRRLKLAQDVGRDCFMEVFLGAVDRRPIEDNDGVLEKDAVLSHSLWKQYTALHRSIFFSLRLMKSFPTSEDGGAGLLSSQNIKTWITFFEKTEETLRSLTLFVFRSLGFLSGFTSSGRPSQDFYSESVKGIFSVISRTADGYLTWKPSEAVNSMAELLYSEFVQRKDGEGVAQPHQNRLDRKIGGTQYIMMGYAYDVVRLFRQVLFPNSESIHTPLVWALDAHGVLNRLLAALGHVIELNFAVGDPKDEALMRIGDPFREELILYFVSFFKEIGDGYIVENSPLTIDMSNAVVPSGVTNPFSPANLIRSIHESIMRYFINWVSKHGSVPEVVLGKMVEVSISHICAIHY